MSHAAAVPPAPGRTSRKGPSQAGARAEPAEALVREAEAQRALAELFPHLQPDALRAIQALFPLARPHFTGSTGSTGSASDATAH